MSPCTLVLDRLQAVRWLAKDLIWVIPDSGCGGALPALAHWVWQYQVSMHTPKQH